MIKAGLGQAECVDTLNATRLAIGGCKEQMGHLIPQAGIVFACIDFDHRLMLDEIIRSFPGIDLIGCTTAGEFSSAYDFSDDSVALMVLYSDTIEISAGVGRNIPENPESVTKAAIHQAKKGLSQHPSLCLTFPEGHIRFPEMLLDTLTDELGHDCPVFGGRAGRYLDHLSKKTYTRQFFKNEILEDGLPLLLLAGPLEFGFSVDNSWQPVGRPTRVTASKGSTVMRIGDFKALDFYRHYLGKHTYPAVEFPLAVYEADGEHFYIRGISGYNEADGSITFLANVPEGAIVQLTEVIRDSIIESTGEGIQKLTQAYPGEKLAFALAFSCALRKYILGTQTPKELQLLKTHLPPHLPIIGFYSFGEFSPLARHHPSRFHNATLVSLL